MHVLTCASLKPLSSYDCYEFLQGFLLSCSVKFVEMSSNELPNPAAVLLPFCK